jgi:hypothetical protein
MNVILSAASLWLASLFLYSAALKFVYYERVGAVARAYQFMPAAVATATGFVLPWIEAGAGFLLLVPGLVVVGASSTAVLGGAFALAVSRTIRRGGDHDCGCAGPTRQEPVSRLTAARAVFVSVVSLAIVTGVTLGATEYVVPWPLAVMVALLALVPAALELRARLALNGERRRQVAEAELEVERLTKLLARGLSDQESMMVAAGVPSTN